MLLAPLAGADIHTQTVKKVEASLAPPDFAGLYEFTNHRLDGTISINEVRFQVKDMDHTFGVFEKPEREKGRQILRADDALWTFLPSVGRAMRIADRDSFAGGDFSNADVLRADWTAKYNVTLAKETPNQWIFDLKASTTGAAYAKMRLWVDKKTVQPVQQFFYDSKGTQIKKCLYGSVRAFGAVTRPAHLVMENVLTGQRSELKILDFKTGQKIKDSRFVVDNLGK